MGYNASSSSIKKTSFSKRYPYLFRKDFPDFEDLPVLFYPFDDMGYLPFFPSEGRFGAYINFKKPVISRNFFSFIFGS